MLGHLVSVRSETIGGWETREISHRGWLRRLLNALFHRH